MSFHDTVIRSEPTSDLPASSPHHEARALVGRDGTGVITLDDKVYILRITKAGKLILTK
ncbi:hemin uptake protein HemP [Nioella nitratireducens]|uniref:hemin uptake protein HemP n=1 Tax=Nioella nitratireducens TaxID=1287720 RepID=UPI000AF58497|nr:hemin uptake protein HemP [Nioella nitratireducens]